VEEWSCKVYKRCGGCQLDVPYESQLGYKQRQCRNLLGQFGRVEPVIPAEETLHYRHKVSTAVGYSRGRVLTGVWQASGGKLVTVESCALEHPYAAMTAEAVRRLLGQFHIRTYDERSGQGFLRFFLLRIGRNTGEVLLALGTGPETPRQLPEFLVALRKSCPYITTAVRCISTDRRNLVLGEKETVLFGPGSITDRLCGRVFRISAHSFFQINPAQTEKLYSLAVELAGLTGSETVVDAYCGVGTMGIISAERCRQVLSFELNPAAAANAKENVRLNGLHNVTVHCGDAGEIMGELKEKESVDVVFTDPPRAGCSREFLQHLCRLAPKRVVYVSCNPETLARDLKMLTGSGYTVKRICPIDLFPWTRHCETVVLLSKLGEAKHRITVELKTDELDLTPAEAKASYEEIRDYVKQKFSLTVSHLNIAQVKRKNGIIERENYNLPKNADSKQPKCTPEKEAAITEALKHFKMIK